MRTQRALTQGRLEEVLNNELWERGEMSSFPGAPECAVLERGFEEGWSSQGGHILRFKECTTYGGKRGHQRSESADDQEDSTCTGEVRGEELSLQRWQHEGWSQCSAGGFRERDTLLSTLHLTKGNR